MLRLAATWRLSATVPFFAKKPNQTKETKKQTLNYLNSIFNINENLLKD